jgi:hypothetical protein
MVETVGRSGMDFEEFRMFWWCTWLIDCTVYVAHCVCFFSSFTPGIYVACDNRLVDQLRFCSVVYRFSS